MRKFMPLLAALMFLIGLTMTVQTYAANQAEQLPPPVQVAQLDTVMSGGTTSDAGTATMTEGSVPEDTHIGVLLAAGVLALWSLRRRLL